VLVLTDASRSNLIHWTNTRTIEAEIEGTAGRGFHRRFSTFNLVEVQLCATLTKFRLPVATLQGAVNVLRHFHLGALAGEDEIRRAAGAAESCLPVFASVEHRRNVSVWAELRAGSLIRGVPDPAWSHFIGLFLDGDGRSGTVAIDPPDLQPLIDGSAIVIDLADVVWRVGEKFARLGCEPVRGSW